MPCHDDNPLGSPGSAPPCPGQVTAAAMTRGVTLPKPDSFHWALQGNLGAATTTVQPLHVPNAPFHAGLSLLKHTMGTALPYNAVPVYLGDLPSTHKSYRGDARDSTEKQPEKDASVKTMLQSKLYLLTHSQNKP